jgi:tetratricopeptide (TPR) repeat protein
MSPEQAEFNARDIDTRTDVYGLGVLLYELLTGTTPLTRQRLLQTPLTEVLRLIREQDPPTPSTRLRASKDIRASFSAKRGRDPVRLCREVRGDLDWIVMKCLEKDRNRRYATANGLARDIERFLNEEPVEACPPSAGYRLRKFAQRNRRVLAAATAFLVLLTAGTVVSVWQAVRATRAESAAKQERDRAVAEKERADEQAAIARAVNDFFQNDLLAQASADKQARPGQKVDRNITVRALLDRAGADIAGKFEDQPLVEANIRNTMGIAYDQLGEHAQAQRQFARACELYRHVLGPDDVRTLRAINNLANAFLGQGKLDEARQLFEEVVAVSHRVLGPDSPDTLGHMNNLANVLARLRHWDEARALHEQTLAGRRRVLGPKDLATLQSLNNLADVLRIQGKLDDSRRLQEEALEGQLAVLGPEHPHSLGSMYNLALLSSLQGRIGDAITMYEKVLQVQRSTLGPTHPNALASMNNLAWLLATAADPKFRDPRRAVQLAQEVVQGAANQGDKWNTLGVAMYRAGDWQGAVAALEKSEQLAPGQSTAENYFFLAMAHWQLGEKDKAKSCFVKAAGWMDKNQPGDHELLQCRAEASKLIGAPDARAPKSGPPPSP